MYSMYSMDLESQAWDLLQTAVKKEIAEYCQQENKKFSSGLLSHSINYIFKKEFAIAIIFTGKKMRSIKHLFFLNALGEESILRLRNHLPTMPNTFAIMRESRKIYMFDKRVTLLE